MITIDQHNALIDMLAALPPDEAKRILAHALRVLDAGELGTAESLRLAGIALEHLDEMRVTDADQFARVQAAADDFFDWLDGESA